MAMEEIKEKLIDKVVEDGFGPSIEYIGNITQSVIAKVVDYTLLNIIKSDKYKNKIQEEKLRIISNLYEEKKFIELKIQLSKSIKYKEFDIVYGYAIRAALNLEMKEYHDAIEDYKAAITENLIHNKLSIKELKNIDYSIACCYYYLEEYTNANKIIDNIINNDNLDIKYKKEAYCLKIAVNRELNNTDEVINVCSTMIDKSIELEKAYKYRGETYFIEGLFNKAIEDFNELINLGHKTKEIYVKRGNGYFFIDEIDKAYHDYGNALRLGLDNEDICYQLGVIKLIKNKPKEALELLEKSNPIGMEWDKYYRIGRAYYKLGEFKNSLDNYQISIKFNDQNTRAYVGIGDLYRELEEFDEANIYYDKAMKIDQYDDNIYKAKGDIFLSKGEFDRAKIEYNKALYLNDRYLEAYSQIALVCIHQCKYEEAEEFINKAICIEPYNDKLIMNRVAIYFAQDKVNKAIDDINKVLNLNLNDDAVAKIKSLKNNREYFYLNRSIEYLANRQFKNAMNDINRVIIINNKNSKAYSVRSEIYSNLMDVENAIIDISTAIGLCPNDYTLYGNRSHIYYCIGNYEKALLDINKAIELNPYDKKCYILKDKIIKVM